MLNKNNLLNNAKNHHQKISDLEKSTKNYKEAIKKFGLQEGKKIYKQIMIFRALNQKTAYKILKIGGGFHCFGWCFGSYCYLFGNKKGSDFQDKEINQSLFFKKVKNY